MDLLEFRWNHKQPKPENPCATWSYIYIQRYINVNIKPENENYFKVYIFFGYTSI